MADLRFERPETTEQFAYAMLRHADIALPLRVDKDGVTLLDATDQAVMVVDYNGEMADARAHVIAVMVELAVNTCGGFSLQASEQDR